MSTQWIRVTDEPGLLNLAVVERIVVEQSHGTWWNVVAYGCPRKEEYGLETPEYQLVFSCTEEEGIAYLDALTVKLGAEMPPLPGSLWKEGPDGSYVFVPPPREEVV